MKKLRFILTGMGMPLPHKIISGFLKPFRYLSFAIPLLVLLPLGLLLLSFLALPVQTDGYFARLVALEHDCGSGGYVEFELIGDPEVQENLWKSGPKQTVHCKR